MLEQIRYNCEFLIAKRYFLLLHLLVIVVDDYDLVLIGGIKDEFIFDRLYRYC